MKNLREHWYIFIVLVIHSWVISRINFFPYPELFVYPYLTNHGLLPYGQIFDQHFPGLMFLPLNLDNLGMTNEVLSRWWAIGVVCLIQIMIYVIGLKLFHSKPKALLANIFYLMWQPFFEGGVLWIDSFLPIVLLPAFYFTYLSVINRRVRDVIVTGVFLGVGIIFKQVVIPVVLMVGILLWWRRKKIATLFWFGAGVVPIPLVMLGYFYSIGVLGDFWYWTVTFNLTTFAKYGRKYPDVTGLIRVIWAYFPVAGLVTIKDSLAICLLIYILGGLSAIYARFDFVHLQVSLPFMVLGTSYVLSKFLRKRIVQFLLVGYVGVGFWWLSMFYRTQFLGQVQFFDSSSKEVISEIRRLTSPNEEIFLWGTPMHWYALSQTLPAGKVFVFQFPWFLMEAESRVLAGIMQSRPELILVDSSVTMDGEPMSEISPKIDTYIKENYYVFEQKGTILFMKRNHEN